jgi:hypothetical protein
LRSGCIAARPAARETPEAEVTVEEVDRILAELAATDWATERGATEACAKRESLLSDSGLLLPRDNRRAAFYHLSFQEFLAAQRLFQLREPPRDILARTPHAGLATHAAFPVLRHRRAESPERAIGAWRSLLPSFEPAALDANPARAGARRRLEVAHAKAGASMSSRRRCVGLRACPASPVAGRAGAAVWRSAGSGWTTDRASG